jgi:hypothetical protein
MTYSKVKSFLISQKNKVVAASGIATSAFILTASSYARADLATDIGDVADAVGTSFQTSSVTVLTAILPYVVTVSIIFLAAKLALRWMKKSAK